MINQASQHESSAHQNSPNIAPVLPQEIDWLRVGRELPERFSAAPIVLIPLEKCPAADKLLEQFPNAERIFAVDFYVDHAEQGTLLASGAGYRIGEKLWNIDHHAPDPRWETLVSSGNLACRWVEKHGTLRPGRDILVLNHVDCDSVLAALILTGALPPCERFEQAVLDADHRGAPNPLVDILQALSNSRNLAASVEALSRELQGLRPNEETAQALEELQVKRMLARDLVRNNATTKNGVTFIRCPSYVDSDIFLSLLPQSSAIVIGCPSQKYPGMELTRLRLGTACPHGVSLHRLGVSELDPYFGGRFDAGSNKRGLEQARASGAMPKVISAQEHFEALAERIGPLTN